MPGSRRPSSACSRKWSRPGENVASSSSHQFLHFLAYAVDFYLHTRSAIPSEAKEHRGLLDDGDVCVSPTRHLGRIFPLSIDGDRVWWRRRSMRNFITSLIQRIGATPGSSAVSDFS